MKSNKIKLKMPTLYVTLFILIVIACLATYLIPAGEYVRVIDEATGRTVVDPNSFTFIEQNPVGIGAMFTSLIRGLQEAAQLVFFVLFAYGFVFFVIKSGAMNGGIGTILRMTKGKPSMIIPIFMILFGFLSAISGMYEETYGLIPLFVGLAIAMGYDAIVGMSMVCLGLNTGFATGFLNPFTIGVAQSIAEVPLYSGMTLRIIVFILNMGIVIWWTMRYAKKVKNNPESSLVRDVDFSHIQMNGEELVKTEFTSKQKATCIVFALTFVMVVIGSMKLGWYLDELAGLFFVGSIIVAIINKWSPNRVSDLFCQGCSEIITAALVIGFARSILIVLGDGQILDSIIYYLSLPLSNLSGSLNAIGMLVIQTIINFFIPSGSAQAATVMPIMAPLSDILGMNRQIAVLAFQMGDGFSNLLWPTAYGALMCSIAKIPLDRWYKFFVPLYGIIFVFQCIVMVIAVQINYA